MPRWVLPATILFLIGVAFVFRWEYGPVQYYGLKTAVYKHDRWTGQDWVKIYESSYEGTKIRENPVPYDRDARKNRDGYQDWCAGGFHNIYLAGSCGTGQRIFNEVRKEKCDIERRPLEGAVSSLLIKMSNKEQHRLIEVIIALVK